MIRLGHESISRKVANAVMDNMKVDKVVWAQYRVGRNRDSDFLAALQDAISFYAYVLSLGYDPKISSSLATQLEARLLLESSVTLKKPLSSRCLVVLCPGHPG